MNTRNRAKELANFYFKLPVENKFSFWTSHNDVEVVQLVDELIEAAKAEVRLEYEDRISALGDIVDNLREMQRKG